MDKNKKKDKIGIDDTFSLDSDEVTGNKAKLPFRLRCKVYAYLDLIELIYTVSRISKKE